MLVTSTDGLHWSRPQVLFPEYALPDIDFQGYHIPAGTKAVMHQRMGFYVAPNGRLLASGFYSFCPTPRFSPNAGQGIGRVVREIREDGSLGPVYFIRYNRHNGWNEGNTDFPFYKASPDTGFVAACDSLLANKLVTLQWWEEDRAKDGFYPIDPGDVRNAAYFAANITTSAGAGKAFCFFHRADGVVVGLWKNQYSALSPDEGRTWTKITLNKTLWDCGAKTWGQRTDDRRYALVYDHSATRNNRFPLVVMTSDDGHLFDDMLVVCGEVPPKRYFGLHKNPGPQYVRGIVEGNGNPPGDHMWIVFSMNKEDIWVGRIHVPVTGVVKEPVSENFENVRSVHDLELWNFYRPQWAPISIVMDQSGNRCLELCDEEPYDYALAERIFPEARRVSVHLRLNPVQVSRGYHLAIEVQDPKGTRPMRVRIDRDWLSMDLRRIKAPHPIPIELNHWYAIQLELDCDRQAYDLFVNGERIGKDVRFAERVDVLQRLVLRTGPYRGHVTPPDVAEEGQPSPSGFESEDLPGADEPAPPCVYWIDDVRITPALEK
jgi:hypothetical protein